MANSLEIHIKTLTPLWTGGVDGTCDRLHISGLMGSLRYWYEAIVRGVGGYACDPSNGGGCIYSEKEKTKSICAACYLFGTTGWARLFRLTLKGDSPRNFNVDRKKGITTYSPHQAIPLHFLFRPIAPSHRYNEASYAYEQLKALLWFTHTYGGLGAKQQKKNGQVEIQLMGDRWTVTTFSDALDLLQNYPYPRSKGHLEWPDIRQYFSFIYQGTEPNKVDAPFHRHKQLKGPKETPLKNSAIRTWFEKKALWSEQQLDLLLGKKSEDEQQKRASRICMNVWKDQGQYVLHIYGFGLPYVQSEEYSFDGVGIRHIIKEYFQECWPQAIIKEQWDGTLLPQEAHQ